MRAHRDKRELTERNQRMLAMRREGKTLREIGETFHVSDVRVHGIVQREKLREQFEAPHKFSTVLT